MFNKTLAIAAIGALAAVSTTTQAAGAWRQPNLLDLNRNISLAVGASDFDYKETAGGQTVDTEKGTLKTLHVTGDWLYRNRLYLSQEIRYSFGSTDYDGALTTGNKTVPWTTTTDNHMLAFQTKVGYAFYASAGAMWIGYGEFGRRGWDRDIRGQGGFKEQYTSNHIGLGVSGDIALTSRLTAQVGAMFGTTLRNSMEANVPGVGHVNVDLGDKTIWRATAGVDYRFARHWHAFGKAQYRHSGFGKSNAVKGMYEPDSTTRNVSVLAGIRYTF